LGKGDYGGMTPEQFKQDVCSNLEVDGMKDNFLHRSFDNYKLESGDETITFGDWLELNKENLHSTWNDIVKKKLNK
jgi:hypothetical protein